MTPATFAIPGDLEAPTGGYLYERRLLEALRAQGREIRHLALPDGFPDPAPADAAASLAALAALPANRPVILDGFLSGALDPAGIAQLRAPFVAVVHHPLALEKGLPPGRAERLYRIERANLARAAHVLVPSPHTRALLVDRYAVPPGRVTVARPGTDRPGGAPAPADPPLILSVGLLHPRKGHDVLIAALERVADLDWQAVIVGAPWDLPHAAALARQAEATGLGPRLRLAGRVGTEELHRLYRAASLFALATRFEGYGIVFDEALAAGLPIVTCATGAVPDTVPAAAGLLVPPGDAAAFATALRGLLSDPAERDRRAAAAAALAPALGTWSGTARIAGAVLDRIARG